jgi:signal transduction histidine kinase
MEREPEIPGISLESAADSCADADRGESPEKANTPDNGAFILQPGMTEAFQQIIDGLPEQIALVDEQWIILAVNPAWTKTADLYGYDELRPGANYLAFCEARAAEGHKPAEMAANGIRKLESSSEPSFRYIYHGSDRWEGFAFQLCINRVKLAGRDLYMVTRYDVSELVQLRQLREEYSHSLIEHQGEERRRIAREVHDSTMQLLAGIGLSIGHLKLLKRPRATDEIVGEMEDLLGEAQRELRTLSFLAHAPAVSELGLAQAIRQLAGGFGRRTGLNIATNAIADADLALSPAAEAAVYRMVQEALSNVHRHARATDVAIGIYRRRSMVHVAVADNGIGMPREVRKGVGLSSMHDRIAEIGGRLAIRAGNPGTLLIASIPAHADTRAVGGLALAS